MYIHKTREESECQLVTYRISQLHFPDKFAIATLLKPIWLFTQANEKDKISRDLLG